MADYNSDRTGSNIDAVLDKADNLTQAAVGVGGNVGIGTVSPSGKLTISGNFETTKALVFENTKGTGNTSYIRSHGTNGGLLSLYHGGNRMQGWDSDGSIVFEGNGAERARIDSSGNLLVGTTSTDGALYNGARLFANGLISGTRAGSRAGYFNRNTTDGVIVDFAKDGSTVGSIGSSVGQLTVKSESSLVLGNDTRLLSFSSAALAGSGIANDAVIDLGTYNRRFKDLYLSGGVITSSDYRLKEDVKPMQSYADTIKQMNLVNFAWKDSGEREDGFIAHELQALVPSAVRGDKDAIDEDGNEQYQGVDPLKLIPVLTKALQEALERIETLENK